MAPDISIPMTPSPQVVHDCNLLATANRHATWRAGPRARAPGRDPFVGQYIVVIESQMTGVATVPPPSRPLMPARETPRRARINRRVLALHLAVIGGFTLLGVLLWWHVWITGSPTSTITCQCGDPSQELWFLTWTPWALIHGHSPFLSNAMFAGQGGANMITNTSWMVPSIVMAPITWLFGPIASFNILATLAPALSGWCFFVAARKVTTFVPGQVLGGLLFGFSPFVLQNDPFGHINWTLLFFPPLAFILLYDLAVTQRRTPVRTGIWLAVLVVVQFFTSTEMLAICIMVIVLTLVAAAVMAPRIAWGLRDRFLTAGGVAAGIVVVVLAYPVWFVLAGPRHITGVPWANASVWGTTPWAVVNAGSHVHASSYFDRLGGYFGGIGPNAGPAHLPSLIYFGIPLIAFVAVSVVTWYRSRLAWTIAIGTLIAWLLSFGTTMGNEASSTPDLNHQWWLPWRLFNHVPLVSDILPIRFDVAVIFGVALLFAISLDRWASIINQALGHRHAIPAAPMAWYRRPQLVAGSVLAALGVALLLPVALTSAVPFTVESSPMPAWFTRDAPRLPAGTIVLVVPFADQRAMGWQAQTGLHFDLAGGFAVVPDASGRSAFVSPPGGAIAVLNRLSPDPQTLVTTPLPATAAQVAEVRAAILRWNVGVTVVTLQGRQPTYSAAFFTAVYGRAPSHRDGVWVWTGPPGTGTKPISSTVLSRCTAASAPATSLLSAPECVANAIGAGSDNS
jgi:hypothetical protein